MTEFNRTLSELAAEVGSFPFEVEHSSKERHTVVGKTRNNMYAIEPHGPHDGIWTEAGIERTWRLHPKQAREFWVLSLKHGNAVFVCEAAASGLAHPGSEVIHVREVLPQAPGEVVVTREKLGKAWLNRRYASGEFEDFAKALGLPEGGGA